MKNPTSDTARSKLLAFVLRHEPESAGLTLAPGGWVSVEELLRALEDMGRPMTQRALDHIVATSPKKSFTYSDDKERIRAASGHTVEIETEYFALEPPPILYYGALAKLQWVILEEGLKPDTQQFVVLSDDKKAARDIAKRMGKPVVFEVASGDMHAAGHVFYQDGSNVWFTASVPPDFLSAVATSL